MYLSQIDLIDLILILSVSINLIVIFLVLFRKLKYAQNIYFSGINFGLVLWVFSNFSIDKSNNFQISLFWTKLSGIGIMIFISFIVLFFKQYPLKQKLKTNALTKYYLYFGLLLALFLIFTNLLVANISIDFFPAQVSYGPMYIPLIIWIITGIVISIYYFFNAYNKIDLKIKGQMNLIAISFSILILISIFTNLLLPNLGNKDLTRIGPITSLLFCLFNYILILRYQFLEIRIILGRITYFFLTGSVAYIAFYLIIIIENALFGSVFSPTAHLVGVVIAIAFVATFNYTNRFIRKQVNSRLINPFYDPNEEITDFNGKVTTTLDYEKIAQAAIETFAKTLRPSYEGLLVIRNGNDDLPDSIKLFEGKTQKIFNVNELKLLQGIWKIVGFVPINVDKIENSFPPIFKNLESEIGRVTAEMNKHNIKILYPLVQSGEILGILFLGQKEAELPYNSIENEFIASIANIASLALARAFLYTEVREFNHTLQQKIEAATKEIQEKNQKLQDTLNFERDMLDILGHELRTPLGTARNALLTLQKLSLDGKLETDNLNKLLSLSIDHIRREVQLLETILASTKVDNAKLDLDITEVDAKKVATTSFEIYSSDAQKKGLDIGLHLPDTDIICMADSLRLQQVIDNIVSNAIKYTSKGQIVIEVKNLDDYVCFAIKDTGEGIAANEIPNLGKKFYRVNTYLKSEGKLADDRKIVRPGGTGIGLYVVFELTKAMKGKVEVKSKPAEGSVFSVFIPKKKSQDYLL